MVVRKYQSGKSFPKEILKNIWFLKHSKDDFPGAFVPFSSRSFLEKRTYAQAIQGFD